MRRLCSECKHEDPDTSNLLKGLPASFSNDKSITFWKGEGCDACNFTGYTGRVGIHEVINTTPALQRLINDNGTAQEIEDEASKGTFCRMSYDGIKKATIGLTTISEVYRVAPPPAEELVPDRIPSAELVDDVEAEEPANEDHVSVVSSVTARKILVCEDEEFTLLLIKGILEGEGYTVITARDGTEGLKNALLESPDLIVTDYMMPRGDGIALIKKLKSKMATSYIPVIMLTGTDELDLEVEGLNRGADDFMLKPVNARKLIARVSRLLRKSTSQ
ncbi:MAG: response regulator [Gammaproteobacteria bacterium]|nr:response regulator [Gammaproteobacteria bacterium]